MNQKKDDLPAMPFYVGDWLKCPEVRALPLDYRALWFDMLCFMWESTERGVLIKSSGEPYSDQEIIRMVGLDNQSSGIWLTTLIKNHVCCRRDDGAIYSKRMVKNEEIRLIRAKSGSKGGNPNLLVNYKDKQKVNQKPEYENEDVINNTTTPIKDGIVKGRIPTLEEVKTYCLERNNHVDPNKWHNFYTAKDWMIGKNKMKDWKAAVRTWEDDKRKFDENGVPMEWRTKTNDKFRTRT